MALLIEWFFSALDATLVFWDFPFLKQEKVFNVLYAHTSQGSTEGALSRYIQSHLIEMYFQGDPLFDIEVLLQPEGVRCPKGGTSRGFLLSQVLSWPHQRGRMQISLLVFPTLSPHYGFWTNIRY